MVDLDAKVITFSNYFLMFAHKNLHMKFHKDRTCGKVDCKEVKEPKKGITNTKTHPEVHRDNTNICLSLENPRTQYPKATKSLLVTHTNLTMSRILAREYSSFLYN
jgi:hypothetical protein